MGPIPNIRVIFILVYFIIRHALVDVYDVTSASDLLP